MACRVFFTLCLKKLDFFSGEGSTPPPDKGNGLYKVRLFKSGGKGFSPYVMLEVHFNNQERRSGVVDSSGIQFAVTKVSEIIKQFLSLLCYLQKFINCNQSCMYTNKFLPCQNNFTLLSS